MLGPVGVVGVVAVIALGACRGEAASNGEGDAAAASGDTSAPPHARRDGRMLVNDAWIEVAPKVLHDAKMDLSSRCKILRDDAKAQGRDAPLCYDPERKPARQVTRIVVERDLGMARAMRRLTAADEGVHFVVEKNGGIYQVLDLTFVVRHGGVYPDDEIRVVACQAEGEAALVAALKELYPSAAVTTIDMTKGDEP